MQHPKPTHAVPPTVVPQPPAEPTPAEEGDVTRVLAQIEQGDGQAAEVLFPLVEQRLREIVGGEKKQFKLDVDQSTTGLIDEAFVSLVGDKAVQWTGGREQFFGYAARKIHDLLIRALRKEQAVKRPPPPLRLGYPDGGGDPPSVESFDAVAFELDLQLALEKFESVSTKLDAELLRGRVVVGATFRELAEIYDISETQTKQRIQNGQRWLQRELRSYVDES